MNDRIGRLISMISSATGILIPYPWAMDIQESSGGLDSVNRKQCCSGCFFYKGKKKNSSGGNFKVPPPPPSYIFQAETLSDSAGHCCPTQWYIQKSLAGPGSWYSRIFLNSSLKPIPSLKKNPSIAL